MDMRNGQKAKSSQADDSVHLLVMNCHEPWVHQLRYVDAKLDVVVDLPGRKVAGWDVRMRPVPPGATLRRLDEVRNDGAPWDAVICHNISDLLDVGGIDVPKIFVLHETLSGRMAQQGATFNAEEMTSLVRTYLRRAGGQAVGVTPAKATSWGFGGGEPLTCCADPDDYLPPVGDLAAGIRVANHVTTKRVFLAWDFHLAAFDGLPVTLVGHNPELGVRAAESWDELKQMMSRHRFMVHTADPAYEDGYNMAVAEGMAAGLPIISNVHPTSPVTHGVDGFLARTPAEARMYARMLLSDATLARRMGDAARATARRRFAPAEFRRRFLDVLASARAAFAAREPAHV